MTGRRSKWTCYSLRYPGVAYLAATDYPLGDNANLPNVSFQVKGLMRYDVNRGIPDANPRDIARDILTNTRYDVGMAGTMVDPMITYSDFCVASGIFLSPAYIDQACLSGSLPSHHAAG